MAEKINLSISQAGTFQTCAYKWHLQYERGLRKQYVEVSPLSMGTLVHLGLAAAMRYYWGVQSRKDEDCRRFIRLWNDNAVAVSAIAIEGWSDENRLSDISVVSGSTVIEQSDPEWDYMIETAKELVEKILLDLDVPNNYEIVSAFVADEQDTVGEEVPLIEHWMELGIPGTNYVFRGVVDVVLRDLRDGQIEVIDWKTRRQFVKERDEELNMQIGIYQYMLYALYGIEAPVGTIYQIKSDTPNSPKYNQDGSLNKRYANYEWTRPVHVIRNTDIQARLWDNLVLHANRIRVHHETYNYSEQIPRAYNRSCNWCTFRPICFAELHGHDVEDVIDRLYENRFEGEE